MTAPPATPPALAPPEARDASCDPEDAPPDDFRGKWRGLIAFNLVVLAWLLVVPVGGREVAVAANILGPLLACWWCMPGRAPAGARGNRARAGAGTVRARLSSACFFFAIAIYATGGVVRLAYPDAAAAWLFLNYPLVIAGILLLPLHGTCAALRARVLVDSLMTVTAVATFSWYFLLGPILSLGADSPAAAILSTAYPVFDLVMLFFVLLVSGRAQSRAERKVIAPLSLGLLGMVVGDTARAYLTLHGSYTLGTVLDVFPPLSFMLLALGARTQRLLMPAAGVREPANPPSRGAAAVVPEVVGSQWRLMMPYGLMPATIALLSYVYYHPHSPWLTSGVYTGATLLLVLLFLRQLLAITENVRLNQDLQESAAQLAAGNRSLQNVNATLSTSEERFRIAAASAGDVIYEWDVAGGALRWFGDVDGLLGYPPGGFARTVGGWSDAIHPDDRRRVTVARARHLETGDPYSVEYRVARRDGRRLYWTDRGCAVRDPGGMPLRMIGAVSDITARKEAEERLRYDSLHDALTGLPNRTLFRERIERCLERARQDPSFRFAVLFLDLDRFKLVNDSLGHAAGDVLLTMVAERLQNGVRAVDCVAVGSGVAGDCETFGPGAGHTVARMGGDEFTVLLEGVADEAAAVKIAQRLLRELTLPVDFAGHEVFTGASLGVVPDGAGYASAKDLLRDADVAMYHAKSAGRGTCAVFNDGMRKAVVSRLRLESDLRRAVERRELLLYYQPIVSLLTREVVGFEALVRWRRDGKLISPSDFIPVAEDTGLIIPIGDWVLREACRQLGLWRQRRPHLPDLFVSVNLSRKQLSDQALPVRIRNTIAGAGLPPACIKLEITESALMEDADAAMPVLTQIRALGVRLQMDDFGTGYSSLGCLHRFPLHGLKIDRSFVMTTGVRRDYAAVIQAILTLARNLGIEVVAEGVETAEQVALLQAMDCELGQGYYFAEPLPPADAEKLLDAPLVLARSA